ncbi:MAG TPA: MaoC/PaaZ C-terminal domain-containing protein [Solirubrobacteraceae bacterium]
MPDLPGLTGLYVRAVAASAVVPVRKVLPGRSPTGLPDTEEVVEGLEVRREHLLAYQRVCGFRVRDVLPATYVHQLAFPLALRIMTSGSFPFPAMGLVHLDNEVSQLRELDAAETLTLRVRAENLTDHPKGRTFDIVAEAEVGQETPWRSTSTYLHKGGGSGEKRSREDDAPPPAPQAIWKVPGDIGRRYAGVTGDRNPIHLHPVTAKAFGMRRPIAHGMWVKARCLAALESLLPPAYTAAVRFKAPLGLPSTVAFSSRPEDGGRAFSVRSVSSGRPHLEGTVRPTVG